MIEIKEGNKTIAYFTDLIDAEQFLKIKQEKAINDKCNDWQNEYMEIHFIRNYGDIPFDVFDEKYTQIEAKVKQNIIMSKPKEHTEDIIKEKLPFVH